MRLAHRGTDGHIMFAGREVVSGRMAGIADVARKAGASRTTVSHVFSGKRPVAPATRERVIEAARVLQYIPHSTARGLATGRSMTFGLVLPTFDDPAVLNSTWLKVLEGLSSAAAAAGYGFLIASAKDARPARAISETRSRPTFDGIIVLDPLARNRLIPQLIDMQIPVVTVGRYLGRPNVPWVDADIAAGIRRVLRHLRAEGFQRPVLLSVDLEIAFVQDLESAFVDELAHQGCDPVIVRAADLSEVEAYEKATQLLSAWPDAVDAVVTASNRQAIGVLRAARRLGLHVPADLGIAGQGDTVIARKSRPALTSVHARPKDVGAAAVRMLLELISGHVIDSVKTPVDLAIRESTRRRPRLAHASRALSGVSGTTRQTKAAKSPSRREPITRKGGS